MIVGVKIFINSRLYQKNPQESELGRNIIKHSIILIEDSGFEAFTFRKLADEFHSTEASVYRYFENKHLLLLYLVNWYWEWIRYLISINTINITDPRKKLKIIVHTIISANSFDPGIDYVDPHKLQKIVISEGMKTYHTKEVDKENALGFFLSYKNLAHDVSVVIQQVNPDFKYPYILATNLFEMSHNHVFFKEHLPRLTDIKADTQKTEDAEDMLNYFIEKLLA